MIETLEDPKLNTEHSTLITEGGGKNDHKL